jgi:pimeloyl-ACP methyl ester carboxylesterase
MTSDIKTRFVDANGLRFEVDTCGDGERLALCLHGFPEHAFSWRHQLPLLARLGYTAWAPNLRGYGNSSRPPRVRDYRMEHLLADVAGLIDAAGKSSTFLVGHDWGAGIAWMFAIRRIRPLERLCIMNVPHPALFGRRLLRSRQILKSWYIFFFQIPGLPEWLLGRDGARPVGEAFRRMAIDKSRFPEDVLEVYRQNARQPGALRAMIHYYRAAVRSAGAMRDQRELIDTPIEVPTLMLWGEQDVALGKELTYGTEHYVRDLVLRYLPDVSHWVQQEAPETVNAMLESWLLGKPVPYAGPRGRLLASGPPA